MEGVPVVVSGTLLPWPALRREQFAHSDQIQDAQADVGELLNLPSPYQPRASQPNELLQPAEDLLDKPTLALAGREATTRLPALVGPSGPALFIIFTRHIELLRTLASHVRFDAAIIQRTQEAAGVVPLIGPECHRFEPQFPPHPIKHPEAAPALGVPIGLAHANDARALLAVC